MAISIFFAGFKDNYYRLKKIVFQFQNWLNNIIVVQMNELYGARQKKNQQYSNSIFLSWIPKFYAHTHTHTGYLFQQFFPPQKVFQ